MKAPTVKVRSDLKGQNLLLPLKDGRHISTEDIRKFRVKSYAFKEHEEFNLCICLDSVWTYGVNIDFE